MNAPSPAVAFDEASLRAALLHFEQPCYVVRQGGRTGISHAPTSVDLVAYAPPIAPENLGDLNFRQTYGLRYGYMAGAMAGGIASEALVIALGKAGLLGSFGAAGLVPARVEAAIHNIQAALPHSGYAFNLIHSPNEEALERRAVELYLHYGVKIVEASAFLDLTPHIVRYRAQGLTSDGQGGVNIGNRVIAKLSRREVAAKFMQPPPERMLREMVAGGGDHLRTGGIGGTSARGR